jgi:hypothetical protein
MGKGDFYRKRRWIFTARYAKYAVVIGRVSAVTGGGERP